MLFNYFKILFCYLFKDIGGNLFNIIGFMFGVVCCIIIFLMIKYEISFDFFYENNKEFY